MYHKLLDEMERMEEILLDIEMNQDEERGRKRLLAAGKAVLWVLMILVSAFLASRSLMM